MPPSARTSLAILALAALAGCTGSPPPREETAWRDDRHPLPALSLPPLMAAACPGGERPGADAPFTIALPGAVDPDHVPLPATEAERHLFRNCWETLVRIDCEGRLEPGLARSWQAYDGGRSWIFQLRDQARFWDGTPLGAIHVVDSWRRTESLCQERGEPPPFLRFSPRGASLQVLGARELAIHLESPEDWLPWLLAHPGLAVAGPRDEHGWPLGSGPLRPDGPVVDETLLLVPVDGHPDAPRWPSATVRLGDRSDAREHLDTGAQALVTREREVVAYYAARPGTRVEPLPWDRSYYLVVPTEETGSLPRDRRRWTSGWDALELAREVSTQDAEPAAFFLLEPLHGACPVLPPHVPVLDPPGLGGLAVRASRDTDLILWPANDPDAGRLAGRWGRRRSARAPAR